MRTSTHYTFKILMLLILVVVYCKAKSQKTKIAIGLSQFKIEADMSKNEAKEKAIELAKVDAIKKAFGEYVEQESNIGIHSQKIDFRLYGQIKVKGEWIRTIGKPEITFLNSNKGNNSFDTWISCKLKGEVRKIKPKANLVVNTLNNPNKNSIANEFFKDQSVYLHFKSPIDGYLSIFLDDGNSVFRLFPYQNMKSVNNANVEADKDYIFFSKEHNTFQTPADELILTTNKEYESNSIVIVFSENEYHKPILFDEQTDSDGLIIPKSLSKKNFEIWLSENKVGSINFIDIKKQISIKSN